MLAYARGPELPLLDKTISEALDDSAGRNPSGDALVSRHQNIRLSWSEVERETGRLAAGLWAIGIRPGDRIGIWSSSCVEWILLQLATARMGAVLVNVNPAYRSHELAFVLRKSRMKALVLREKDARANYRDILDAASDGQDLPLQHSIFLDQPSWSHLFEAGDRPPESKIAPEDVVNIQYTSGTTGFPKGVMLTHRNLLNNGYLIGHALKITPADRLCAPVPMYHCFGCVMASLLCVVYGIPLVLPAPTFDAGATLAAVEAERCTVLYGVPTMFIAEIEHADFGKYDLTSLRTGIMAGAPCPIEVMRRVVDEMHCREITIAYGQTESSPVITMSGIDDTLETRVSTIGRAMPETEVKIVRPGTNETIEAGERGELCTRGYLVMKGYDDEPAATAQAIDDESWLHTGDLAVMRPDGYFHISGRLKEMIIRGGENVYPREIEEFLHQHPKIADVYIVGVPHEKLGETVLAWIRPKADASLTEEEIREYCRGKIAHFKVPEYIRFVDSFPMTVTGKVQKFRIREQEIEARGLHKAASIRTA
jgi:fatty-acyl-CoA synthase